MCCVTPLFAALRLLTLAMSPPPANDVISMPHFMSPLAHEIAIMCSCPACDHTHKNKHTKYARPAGVGPLDYVIDIERMG